jgi:radical SAM superfamily enzyme YgiQ (UPF0313 family)
MRFLFINVDRSISRHNIWRVIRSIMPPLGIATLAALAEREGAEADVVDAQATGMDAAALVREVASREPYDYIGFSATTPEIDAVRRAAGMIRRVAPSARFVLGGVHATVCHEELVREGTFDIAVRGEGERAVVALAQGVPLQEIGNLTWRDERGTVVVNPDEEGFVDLESLPFPAYHKLPMDRYHSALGAARRFPSIGMITSRGCPGSCTFCFSAMFGKKIRFVSAGRMIEHVRLLRDRYGIREVSFYDDTFTASRQRVRDFCEGLLREGIDLSWSCFARIDTVSADLLKLMRRAGCHQVMYGFEAADDAVLASVNKRVTTESYERVVAWTNEAGINVRGAFMLGNRGESEETMQRTIDLSIRLGITFAIFNITTPYPGTALYDWAEQEGILRHKDWADYDYAHPVLELPGLPGELVLRYYRKAYRAFYLRPAYVAGRLSALRSKDELRMYWEAFRGIAAMILTGAPARPRS